MKTDTSNLFSRIDLKMAVAKSAAVLASYLIGFYLTGSFHDESRYFGAMLASISSVVALQADVKTSIKQGWLRILGTFIGAVIATIYLLLFPFSIVGMIVSVFILAIICMVIKIPDDGRMATITLIVIMLISKSNPDIPPEINSLLRFIETSIGSGIGIAMAWLIELSNKKPQP